MRELEIVRSAQKSLIIAETRSLHSKETRTCDLLRLNNFERLTFAVELKKAGRNRRTVIELDEIMSGSAAFGRVWYS